MECLDGFTNIVHKRGFGRLAAGCGIYGILSCPKGDHALLLPFNLLAFHCATPLTMLGSFSPLTAIATIFATPARNLVTAPGWRTQDAG